jgi:hypothetical protein
MTALPFVLRCGEDFFGDWNFFGIDEFLEPRKIIAMGQAERPTCPNCGAHLILALPPGGTGPRTFQCFDCDGPDPLKTDKAMGWLKGELQPPK